MSATIATLTAERDQLKRDYDEEKKIVDRIWDQLGRPSYEALAGRSIHDLIEALAAERDRAVEALQKWDRVRLTGERLLETLGQLDLHDSFNRPTADALTDQSAELQSAIRVALAGQS